MVLFLELCLVKTMVTVADCTPSIFNFIYGQKRPINYNVHQTVRETHLNFNKNVIQCEDWIFG